MPRETTTRRKFLKDALKIGGAALVGAGGAALIKGCGEDEKAPQQPVAPQTQTAPAQTAPAQATPAPATQSINERIDDMITGGSESITGFPAVPKAIEDMKAALKQKPDLKDDPQFWLRLGGLYGLKGCFRWGDTNTTAEENALRVDGLACFNRALELDSSIANTSLWGHPFNDWYKGMRDTAVYKGGYRGEIGRLNVKVESDGTLKINK